MNKERISFIVKRSNQTVEQKKNSLRFKNNVYSRRKIRKIKFIRFLKITCKTILKNYFAIAHL